MGYESSYDYPGYYSDSQYVDVLENEIISLERKLFSAEKEIKQLKATQAVTWNTDMDQAPRGYKSFIATLSNGWVVVLADPNHVGDDWDFTWYISSGLSIPVERTHPPDTDWKQHHTIRAVAWAALPEPYKNEEGKFA